MTAFDQIDYANLTDVGVRRPLNEDNHAILLASDEVNWREQGHLFLVADGMGGHAVGELASEMAAANIPHTYHKHAAQGAVAAVRRAFQEANAAIYARGQQNPEFKEMGTTATALVLRPEGALIGHVGDSRVYRIRNGQIEQLTFDHSHVWDIARRLGVDPEQIPGISSNLLMRSLGPQPLVQVDIEGPYPIRDNDIFVLCSDGLSGQVTDAELGAIATILPPTEAAQFLIDLANLRGGPDNITVLIVRIGASRETSSFAPISVPTSAAAAKPWYDRLPWWPLAVQLGGILLAIVAALLTYYKIGGGELIFLLAAITIIVGLIGLVAQYNREKSLPPPVDNEPPPELRIYRQASCKAEMGLLNKLSRAVHALHERALEKQWDPDLPVYEKHHEQAQQFHRDGNLEAAFTEYCRAMRPLMEALSRHRSPGEMVLHLWDKGE